MNGYLETRKVYQPMMPVEDTTSRYRLGVKIYLYSYAHFFSEVVIKILWAHDVPEVIC